MVSLQSLLQKQERLFKEPAVPERSTKRLTKTTNELFNQMLITPSGSGDRDRNRDLMATLKSFGSFSKSLGSEPLSKRRKTYDDGESLLSMSSIEGLDSLENRLLAEISQAEYGESSVAEQSPLSAM